MTFRPTTTSCLWLPLCITHGVVQELPLLLHLHACRSFHLTERTFDTCQITATLSIHVLDEFRSPQGQFLLLAAFTFTDQSPHLFQQDFIARPCSHRARGRARVLCHLGAQPLLECRQIASRARGYRRTGDRGGT